MNRKIYSFLWALIALFVISYGFSTNAVADPRPGEMITVKWGGEAVKFAYIPPGTFWMGSPKDEAGRDDDDETRHKVTLTKGFYMQTTEVTQGQWKRFIKETGYEMAGGCWVWAGKKWEKNEDKNWQDPGYTQNDNHPAACISWDDIHGFINWLNKNNKGEYRLPTEAEWEYAARAGTTTSYFWGDQADCRKANYGNGWSDECKNENPGQTMKVGSFPANAWGLYDMHGNVWEWCADWYGDYPSGSVTDPTGPDTGG